jgi:hypothetical protein
MDITSGITITGGLTIVGNSAAAANDPYFMYNTLLLPGNGTNLAQNNTFLDGSTNNFIITRNSNTTQGTFSPYGPNWSNYFDGTGDYLLVPNNSAFDITGDFTVESWVYFTADPAANQDGNKIASIVGYSDGTTSNKGWEFSVNFTGSTLYFASWGTNNQAACAFTPLKNVWYNFVATKQSSTSRLFINGILQTLTTNTLVINTAAAGSVLNIGRNSSSSGGALNYFHYVPGYISNFRIIKGTAVYTSAFTPSTTPLTAISGTSLLTCQSNRFIDNSTNNFTITKNGDVSIQRFSPFSPGATYSTSTIGGSGYFDGGADYLYTPSSSNFALGTGDFTIECWIYVTAAFGTSGSGRGVLMSNRTVVSGSTSFVLQHYNGKIYFGTPNTDIFPTGSNTTMTINTWYHVAVTRNSGTARLFLNGVSDATPVTGDTTNFSDTSAVYIGCDGTYGLPLYSYTGYISDSRIVKGTAVYTANFTPPTAPVTAITNTSLLLNYTNAGIIDNAMMNNLETVGDAKISTTQSKFGGSSMSFDGTGDSVTASAFIALGTGDFTVETWFYLTAAGDVYPQPIAAYDGTYGPIIRFGNNGFGNKLQVMVNPALLTTVWSCSLTQSAALNTWYHAALVRQSGVCKFYLNGTLQNLGNGANPSTYPSTSFTSTESVSISTMTVGSGFTGYIDDLRITKGYARYTSNFTAPTSAFPTY